MSQSGIRCVAVFSETLARPLHLRNPYGFGRRSDEISMVKTARADTIIVTTIVAREVLLEACCLRFEAVAAISPSRLAKFEKGFRTKQVRCRNADPELGAIKDSNRKEEEAAPEEGKSSSQRDLVHALQGSFQADLDRRGSWGWRLAVAAIFDGMSLYIKSY